MAIASFVTMTSVFGSSNFAKAETTINATEVATIEASDSSIQTHLSANFTAPNNWSHDVYAYAYYVENDKTIEPLGCWPGTKLTKKDGTYPVEFESSIGKAKIIYVDAAEVGTIKKHDEINDKYWYDTKELHRCPAEDDDIDTEDGYTIVGGENVTIKPVNVSFTAPESWDNVYAYAYYTDYNKDLVEPLGYWPGTKIEPSENGKYDISIISPVGEAKYIFTNVAGSPSDAELKPNGIGGWYYDVDKKAQIPEDDGNNYTENGYKAEEGDNSFTSENIPTPGPISTVKPTIVPTITPTVTPVITATVTPTTSVLPTVTPSTIPTVTPVITATVTPSAIPTITPTVEPTIIPTVVPTVEPTIIPSVEPVIIPTVTPSAVPTVEPTAIPTVVPTITPTVVPTVIPTVVPTITPTVVPTVIPTIVPTVTPTAVPTVTPDVIPDNPIPNDPIKVPASSTLKGSISFDKTTKTVGETIKIKVSAKNGKPAYKYTYTVKKGNKKVLSVANTKSKSINWIPDKAGTYTVSVKITDAKKKSVTVTKKYNVKSAVITIKSLKTNKSSSQKVKTKIVISANATTKKGKASYKFAVKLGNGKIKTIKGFSSKKKVTWKPTKKGTYTLYVYVKNGKGITVSKTKTFKIKK